MSEKLVVLDFDICHQFVNKIRRNISSKFFDFYGLTNLVFDEEFNIFIAYNPSLIVYINKEQKTLILLSTVGRFIGHLLIKENLKFTDDVFTKEVVISFSVI